MTPVLIEFRRATLGYGRTAVLRDLSFAVRQGDYLGLVGPNGAGKTTILRTILGVLPPLEGEVHVRGASGGPLPIGYVPQREGVNAVLPYTAAEVVLMGRYRRIGPLRRPGAKDRAAVRASLAHVDAEALADLPYRDLSGGQKQRVLIARALATEPELLILDEPTNGMDLPSRLAILDLVRTLHGEGHLTVIMVSHLLDDVANHVKRIAIVERDVFQVGDVGEVLTGQNLSALYHMPVQVQTVAGRTMIVAGGAS